MTHNFDLRGVGLIALFWAIITFIAFIIFNQETDVKPIIFTWTLILLLVYLQLKRQRWINKAINITAIITTMVLLILYFIPINKDLPQEALDLNKEISERNQDKYQYAKELFFETEKKWTGPTRQYLLEPHKVFFIKDTTFFWNVEGYVPSNIQSQIYQGLLLESGRFTEEEVVLKQGVCTNSPHGYVEIKHPDRVIYADHWAVDHFDYKFGQVAFVPCTELVGEEF